jgi:channel protein (hemolysin III family)
MDIISIPGFSEPFSSISHLLAALASLISTFILLYRGRGNISRIIGLLIYCFCLVLLFSLSGVYHLLEKGFQANYVLQILDYSAIFTLISGTITPIHVILFRGLNRWLVLTIVWTLAITGLTLTAIFFKEIPEWLSLTFFLGLGWFGLFTIWSIYKVHNKSLMTYIIVGGLFYTFGAVIEFVRWPVLVDGIVGPHEIFHLFVILGAYCHWKLVYRISTFPISSRITIIVKEFPNNIFKASATSEHIHFEGSSVEEIKSKVMDWIEQEFHHEMKPERVNFKYFKEENILVNPL